jgi:hypothetical protein
MRAADDAACLTDGRKNGVRVSLRKIRGAIAGILEERNGIAIAVGMGYARDEQKG